MRGAIARSASDRGASTRGADGRGASGVLVAGVTDAFSVSPSPNSPLQVLSSYGGIVEASGDGGIWDALTFSGGVAVVTEYPTGECYFRYKASELDEWVVWADGPLLFSAAFSIDLIEPTGAGMWSINTTGIVGSNRVLVTGDQVRDSGWGGSLSAFSKNTSGATWNVTFEVRHRETGKIVVAQQQSKEIAAENQVTGENCQGTDLWGTIGDGFGLGSDQLIEADSPQCA